MRCGLKLSCWISLCLGLCEPQARDQRIRRSFVERGSASHNGMDLIVSWSCRKTDLMLLKIAYSVRSNLFFIIVSILSVEFLVFSFYFMTMIKRRRRRKNKSK